MKIRNLLFDLGGVILDIRRENAVAALEALGLTKAGSLLGDYGQEGVFGALESGLITPDEFHAEIRAAIGRPVTDAQIDDAFNQFLIGIPVERLRELERLRRHFRIYMLSNTNLIMWRTRIDHCFRVDGHDMDHYFDGTATSFEAKVCKPDARIFEYATRKFGLDPRETLFLDDSEANCNAGRAAGFHAAHVPSDTGFLPVVEKYCGI